MRALKLTAQYAGMLALLPEEARKKAESFKREEDRIRSVVGALLIRRGIEETLRKRKISASYHISYGKYGKPYVAEYPDICFSLSHSGDLITYVKAKKPIGIDVEMMNGDIQWSDFSSFLSLQEMKRVMSSESKITEFYRIWTIHEAFAKMNGRGLSLFDTKTPLIDYDKGRIEFQEAEYMMKSFECENHMISVCMENLPDDVCVHLLAKDEWNDKVICKEQ